MAIDDLTTEQAKAKEQELIANKLIETIKGNNELRQNSQNDKESQQDSSKNPIVALRDSLRKTTVQYNDSVEKQNLTHQQQNENIALNDAHMTESGINEGQYQSNKQYANQLFNALGVPSDPLQLSKNLQQAMNLESDIDYQLNVAIPTKTKQAYENEALSNQHSLQQIRLSYDQARRNIINSYNQVIEDRERFKEVLGAKNIESRLSSYLKSQAAHDFQTLIAASANTRQEAEQEISYGFWGNTVEAAGRGVIHLLDKSLEGWGLVGSLILGDGKGVRPHIVSNLAAKLGFNNISLNDITRNNFGFTDRLGLALVSDTLFNSLPEMFAMGGALGALTKFGGRLLAGMEGRLNSAIARAGSNTELRNALIAIKDSMAGKAKWTKTDWDDAVAKALNNVAEAAAKRGVQSNITAKTIDAVLKGAMKADAVKSGLAATYMISDYAGRVNDMINQRGPNATLQISDLLTAFIHMGVDYAGAAAVFAKFFKAPEAGIAKFLFGENSSVLKAVPGQMAIEGVGEGIQTYMEALSRHSGALPDLLSLLSSDDPQYSQLKSELAESSVLGALSGGIIGGVASGAASITNKVSESISSFRNNERMRREGEQVADTEFDGSKHAEEYAAKALDPEKQNKNILAEANNNLQSIAGDIQNIAKSEEDLKDMKVTRNNEKNKEIVGRELQKVKEEQQNIAALEKMQQEGKELTEEQQHQLAKKDALETRKNNLETLAKKLEEFDDAYRKVNEAKIAHEVVSATMDSGLFKREDAAKIDEVIEKIANAKTKEESNAAKNELIDLMNLEGGNKLKRAKAALLKALNQDPRIYSRTRDIKDGATTAIKGAARAVANAAGKTSTAIKGGYSRAARAARAAGTALFGDEDATIETGISEQQEESTTQEQSEETQDAASTASNETAENTEELDTETTVESNQEEETESEQDKNYENLSAEELKSVLKELDADVVFHFLSNELTTNKNKNGRTKGMSEATKWMQTQFSVLRMGLSEADMSISGKAKKRDKSGKDNSASKIPQLLKRAITDLVIIKNDRYFFDFQSGNFIRFFHTVNDNQQAINRVTRMATTAREMFNSQMPKKVNDIRDEIAKLAKIKKDVNPELYQQQKEKIVSMINDLKETYGKNLDTLNFDIAYMRMFISSVYGNSSIATQLSTLTNNISAQLLALTKDAKDIKQLFDVLTSKNIPESKRQKYLRVLEVSRKRKARGQKGWNIDELIARYSKEEESSESTSETKDITSTIRESISTIKKSISPVLDGIKSIVNDVLTAEQEINQEQLASAAQTEKEKQLKNAQEVLLEMQSFFEDLTDIFTVSHIGSAQLYLARNQYINALATTPKTDINLYDNFNIGVMNEALLHMFLSINETMLYDMFKVDKSESALNAINNIINAVLLNKYETNNPAFQSLLLLLRDIKVPIKNILVRRNITDNTRQDQTQEGMISLYDLLSCNEVAQNVYFTQKDIEDAVKAHNIEVEKYNTKKNQKENPIPDKVKIVLSDNGQVAPHEKAMIAPYLKEILRERLLDKQRNKQFRNDLSLAILRNPAVREEINTKLNIGLIILARDLISRSSDTNKLGTIDKANSTEAEISYKKEEKGNNFYYAEKYKAQQELPFLKTMLGIEDVKDINIDDVYQQIMYLAQSHLNSLSYDVNGNPLLQFKQLYILDKTGTSATGRSTTYMIINKDFVRDLKDLYGDTLTEQFKESSSQDSLSHLESIESYNKRKGKDFKPTTAIDILEANTNRLAARDIAAYVSEIFGISIDDMVNKIATSEAIESEEYNDILEAFTKNTNSRRNTINTLNKGINRNNPLMYIPVRRMVYNDTSKTWSKKTDYYYLPDIIGENATKQFIAKINDNTSYTDTMNSIANDFNQTAKATVARIQSRYNSFSDFIYIRGNQMFNNDKELSGFSKFDGEMNFNQDFHIRYKEIETSGRLFTPTTLANPINNKLIKDVMTTDGRHHDVRDKLLKEDRNIFEEDSVEAKKIKRGLELAFYQIFGKDVDKFALTDDGKAAIKALNKNENYVKNGEIIDPEAYDRAVLEILEKHTDYTIDGYSLTNLWKMISNLSIGDDVKYKQLIYDEFMDVLSKYQEKDLKAFNDHPFLSKRNADVIKDFLTALLEGKKDYYKKMYHHSMSIYVDGSATGVFENMIKYKSIPVMAALAKVYTGKSVVFSDNIEEWTEQDLTDKTTQHFQGLSQAMKIEVEERLEKILKDNGILDKYENVRDAINEKGIDPYTLNLAIFQATMAKYAVAWPDNLYAQIVGTTQVYNRDLIKKLILPLLYGAGESSFFVKAFVLALPNHNKQLFSLLEEFQRTYNPNQERGKNDTKSISDDTLTDIRLKFLEFLNSKADTNNIAKIYYQYLSNGNQVTRFHSGLFKDALRIKQTSDRAYYMLSIDFNAINSNIGDFSEMLIDASSIQQKYIPDGIFQQSAIELQTFVENYDLNVATSLDSQKIALFAELEQLFSTIEEDLDSSYHSQAEFRLFVTETMANIDWLRNALMDPGSKDFATDLNGGKVYLTNSPDNKIAKALGIKFDETNFDKRKQKIVIQIRDILRSTGMYVPGMTPSVHDLYTPDILISRQQAAYTRDMNTQLEQQMMYSQVEIINKAIKDIFAEMFGNDVVMTDQAITSNLSNNRDFRNRVYNEIHRELKKYYEDMMEVTISDAKKNVESCLMTKLKNDNLRKKWISTFESQAKAWRQVNNYKLNLNLEKITLKLIENATMWTYNGKPTISPNTVSLFNIENDLRTLPNVLGLFNHNLESAVMKEIIVSNGVSVQIYDGIQSWAGNAVDIINNWNTLFPMLMDQVIDINSLMLKAWTKNREYLIRLGNENYSTISDGLFLAAAIRGLTQISRSKSVAVNNITSVSSIIDSQSQEGQINNEYGWVANDLKAALIELHKLYENADTKIKNGLDYLLRNYTDILNTRDIDVRVLLSEFNPENPDQFIKAILDKYGNTFMQKVQDRFANSILFSSQEDTVAYDYTFSHLAQLNQFRAQLGIEETNNHSDDIIGLHRLADNNEIQISATATLNDNLELINNVNDASLSGIDQDIIQSIKNNKEPKFVDTAAKAIVEYAIRKYFSKNKIDTNTAYKIKSRSISEIEIEYNINGSPMTSTVKITQDVISKIPDILKATLKFYQTKPGKKDLKTLFSEKQKIYSNKNIFFILSQREDASLLSVHKIDNHSLISTTFINNFIYQDILGNRPNQENTNTDVEKTESEIIAENTAWQQDIAVEESIQEEQQPKKREYSEQDEYDGTVRRETMRKVTPEQANAIAEKMLEGLNPTTDVIIHNSHLDENGNIIDDDPVNVAVFNLARERGFKIHSSITDARKIGILFGKQTKKSRNVVVLYNDPNSYDLFETVEVTNGRDGRFVSKRNRELGEFTGDNAVRYNADATTIDASNEEQIAMHNAIVGSRTETVAVKGAVSMSDKISVNSNRETPHHIISYDNLSDRVSTNSNVTVFTDSSRVNEFKNAKDVVLIDNNTPQKRSSQNVEQTDDANNDLYNMNRQYANNGKTKTIDNNHIKPTQPTITPQTSIPSNTKTIDVWFGSSNTQPLSHPSKFLSNMANRPFRYGGREYQSVEHAYQTLKSGKLNENAYKNFGKSGKVKFHELGTKKTDNWNLRLMQKLITTSLLTNSQAREYIRHNNYFEGYTFTHKNGDTTWSKYFGPILMNSINMIKFADTRLSETKDGKDLLQAINLMPLAKRPKVKFIDSNRQVDKDIAMANDADIGIMLWSNNSPGTLNNMKNMSDRHKPYTVYNANGTLNENESNITPLDKDIATDNVTFFISGSRYINALPDSNTEFGKRMDSLNDIPNVSFVVGDAVGVDTNMIKYFVKNNDDLSNVTIYSSRKSNNPQSTPPNATPKKGNARESNRNQYTPEQLEIEGRLLEEGEFKRVLEDRKQQELSNLTDQTEIDAITASYDTAIAVFNNLGNLQVGESAQMSDGRMGEQQTTYSIDENGFVKATNVIQLYGDQRTHTALHETWHGLMDTALHSEFGQRFNEAQNLRHRLVSIMNETINELNNDPEKRLELGLLDDVWDYIINQPTQDLVLHEFYAHFLSQPALAAYLASKTYNQTLSRWNKFIATRKGQNIFKQGANLLKTILGTIFDLLTLATIRNSGNRQALALKTIAKLSAFNTLEGIEQYQRNYNNKLVVRGNKLVKKGFHFVSRNIFKSIEDYITIKGYSEEDIRGLVSEIRTTLQKVAEDLMPYMEQIHDKDVSLPKKYFLLGLATMKMVVASRHIIANPIQREIAMNVLSDIRQQLFEGTFFDFKFNIDFGLIVNKTTKKIVKEVNTIVGINTAFQQEEEIAGRSASNYMKSIIYNADNPTINAWIEENEAEDPDFRKKYSLAIGNYLYVIKPQDYFFNEVSPSIDEVRKIVSYMINDNVAQTQKIRREIGDLHKDIMKIIKENNSHLSAEELEVYSNHIRQSIVDLALTRLNNVSTEDFGTQNVEQILYQIDRMIHNQHKVETSYNPDTGRSTYKSRGLKYSNKNANNGRDITSDTNYQRIVKNLHKMLTLQTINLIHGEYDITKDNNKGKIGSVARFNEETKMITQKALTAYEEGQREFKEEIIDLLVKGALFVHQQEKRYYTKQVLNYSVARGYYENGENISDRFFLDNAKKGTTLSKKSPSYEENKQSLLERGYVISSETETHTRFISKDALWIEKPIFGRDIPLPYYHEGFIPYQQYNPEVDIVTMHIPEDNLEQQEKMEEMLQNYLDKGYEISETYSDMERGIYVLVNNSLITQYHNPTHRLGYIGSVNKAKGKVIDVKEPEMYASEDYTNRTIDSYYERMYEKVKKRGFTGKPTYKDRANKSPKRVMESSKRLRYETGRDMIENLAKIDRSVEAIAYNQEKLITRNQHKDFVNTQTWFHILSHQDEIKQRGPGKQNEHHHAVPLFELHPHERMAVTYSPGTNEWIYEDFRIVVNEDVAKQYNLSFSHEDLSTLANALKATGYNYDTANKDGGFGDTIYVDTNALPMLFGYQDFDPHKIADNDRIRDGRLQKGISTVANILRGLVKESRNNTIIRNPALALENFKSNTIGLIAEGVPVTDTFDSIPRVIDQLFEYQQLLLARKALYTKASTIQAEVYEQGRSHVMAEYRELKKAIRRMDETISNHSLNYVMQNGFYTNIVEDAETVGFRWDEALIDKISKKVGGLNDTIKAALHEALVTEKGEVYNSLAMFTRLGDFVPRVIYYNHLVGMEGVSKEEAIDLARDKFINYNVPMWSPSMRLIDKFGVTNYLKYKTAIQRQILLAFKNNPIQASSLVALQIFAVSNGISQAFAPSTYLVESLLIDGTMPSSFFGNPATTLNRYNNFLPL